jgi:hypothetical protein
LRCATRLLAPIADGEAVVRTFAMLTEQHTPEFPQAAVDVLRQFLMDRQAAVNRHAARHHVLRRVVDRLEKERHQAQHYVIDGEDYPLLAPGFERTIRRSRKAMNRAVVSGTADHYHDWRRRVKDHWLQTRLLNARCHGHLTADAQRLDQLDALLGASHDLALLAAIIRDGVPLTRAHATVCLRVIRREQWAQRHAAMALGRAVYDEAAVDAVDRAARAWRRTLTIVAPAGAERLCPRVA